MVNVCTRVHYVIEDTSAKPKPVILTRKINQREWKQEQG